MNGTDPKAATEDPRKESPSIIAPSRGMEAGKIAGFLAAGLPSFLLAVPLNFLLVDFAGMHKAVAYAIVLTLQITLNFFMCRWFVFTAGNHQSIGRQFMTFMWGILGFRIADWGVYTLLVEVAGFHYLLVQFANVFVFALLKYKFSKRVIEGDQGRIAR